MALLLSSTQEKKKQKYILWAGKKVSAQKLNYWNFLQ